MTHHTRRDFMRLACCSAATASMVGGLSKFGLVSALAQGATDYKALVCIFHVRRQRREQHDRADRHELCELRHRFARTWRWRRDRCCHCKSAARRTSDCIRICRSLQGLFNNQKSLAVLNNVGTLVQPTTQQQFSEHNSSLPENLFSHSDQQDQWQTTQLKRIAERGMGRERSRTMCSRHSTARRLFRRSCRWRAAHIFATGNTTRPFTMSPGSTPGLAGIDSSAAAQARFLGLQQSADAGYAEFRWCRRRAR